MTESSTPSRTSGRPPGLRERMRATVRAEVVDVALQLFNAQGFDETTVDQIAAEAGLSRASLFRYFGTKEDIVLVGLEGNGQRLAEALSSRPENERPWAALRRAFDVLVKVNEDAPAKALDLLRLLEETPSLRARHSEKQLKWQEELVPEIARRLSANPYGPEDPRPAALVAAALACLGAAASAWVAYEGSVPLAGLLDRAMGALTE